MRHPDVEFDDILFHLQEDRGASVYWREVTAEIVRQRPRWDIVRRAGHSWARFVPVPTGARLFHSSLFRLGVGREVENVVTVHDLTYEKGLVPGRRAKVGLAQRRLAVRGADGLVFISEHSRREFAQHYPQAVGTPWVVAWHGRDPSWDGGDERPADPAWGLDGHPYVLHVGHRDGYKNFRVALDGYAASPLPADGLLFVVLGPALSAEESAEIQRRGLGNRVLWRPAPDRRELFRFVSNAAALVYVSREEGFGMPLIEAMQCRTPVVVADASCLPEVAGGAAALVDADDPAAVARALVNVIGPAGEQLVRRGAVRAAEFTWATSAQVHLSLYDRLLATSAA